MREECLVSVQQEGSVVDVQVLDRNVGITSSQRENVERCLHFSLDRFAEIIRSVQVSFSDMNGPKGGEDVLCRLKIALRGKGEVVVEGKGISVESVVTETADRAAMAISRRQDRQRSMQGLSMSGQ